MRRLLAPLGILALGGLAVWLLVATKPVVEERPTAVAVPIVRVETVTATDVQLHVATQGTVTPRTQSDLVAQVSGEVVWTSPSLAPGGFFEAGELLLRVDRVDYEAELESARATVARAESEARRAAKDLARQEQLADRSVASEARIDDVENANKVAAASVREARARLGRAERDLERTDVRAPYAGRVRSESIDVGQFVSKGATLAKVYAVDYAEVRLPIPDRELRFLDLPLTYRKPASLAVASAEGAGEGIEGDPQAHRSAGPAVELRTEFAGREHVWQGHIVRTEGEIDPRSRMVTVVARVEDPYGTDAASAVPRPPLAVGLFVSAEIEGVVAEGAFVIPRVALRGSDDVFVVDADSRLRLRSVDVLRRERERIVVRGGLEPGERICVSPMPGATDGMKVEIQPARATLARSES